MWAAKWSFFVGPAPELGPRHPIFRHLVYSDQCEWAREANNHAEIQDGAPLAFLRLAGMRLERRTGVGTRLMVADSVPADESVNRSRISLLGRHSEEIHES